MSRPQYAQQYQQPHVVNGGLIDFHDNQNRGICEHAPFSGLGPEIMANSGYGQMPGMMANGMVSGGMMANGAMVNGMMANGMMANGMMANGMMVNGMGPAVMASMQTGMGQSLMPPNVCQPASLAQGQYAQCAGYQGMAAQGPYISGPPTFLHAYGITYKPDGTAEDGRVQTEVKQPPPLKAQTEASGRASGRDIERAIDERVAERVNKFISGQRKISSCEPASADVEAGSRVRKAPAADPVQRVLSVANSMRAPGSGRAVSNSDRNW